MKTVALLTVIAATLAGCASYQPAQANCFNFIAPKDGQGCDFTPLGGPADG
ncbi:hypothetical protein [Jannaschia sp. LMIT008]|uniref:hypothetical protein n=1 Tax=Jannaschia maritima TaxID=3032585 RepID=UPI0028111C18|nr:hypothetical protein [Jannaschia sp. LMIT008]